ncbi:P-loop containing nucleoside triphosphate hydrolase protein [Scheffersomyces xylosifermentans]|uniref:P-loop containing nucleoside triphosphate hydrolase protein n=1 Tax=Scheffersomyces xylosifermentans TaxID=1304137 RepID=UPI00315D7CA6
MSNIQVVVRCRGRNEKEVAAKSPIVIDLPNDTFSVTDPYISINNNYTTTSVSSLSSAANQGTNQSRRSSTNASATLSNYKTYKFDQVYGSQADQHLIFEKVALPLFNDFLGGSNVTILAYGQTGTGKTFTMCSGEQATKEVDFKHSESAGIIPRVLIELFNKLESVGQKDDYLVKCSFLELYNEDLRDLLNDDEKPAKLRIYENVIGAGNINNGGNSSSNGMPASKKLESKQKSIAIQNLREESISNCQDGFKVLQRGVMKRKTASTKLNDVSSRSHTIFTINLYRSQPDSNGSGTSLFKVSKMNLVDLAGSENINRSGAQNQRAKEAGSINQSLLTLGRVINSLSEIASNTSNSSIHNASHIPYRESKLTRLLQDSIGGSTKTTLIATISPAKINIDETISTLDYACKAKNIKNLPQSGQDSDLVMKKVLVKNLSQELVKLNYDLIASRSKNGVWLDEDNFKQILEENESLKASLKEANLSTESLSTKIAHFEKFKASNEINIKNLREQINRSTTKNEAISKENDQLRIDLESKNSEIKQLNERLVKVNEKFNSTTTQLAKVIYENLDSSIESISNILTKYNNSANNEILTTFDRQLAKNIVDFRKSVSQKIRDINNNLSNSLLQDLPEFLNKYNENYDTLNSLVLTLNANLCQNLSDLKIANDKLSGYIIEDHLNYSTQELLTQLIKTKVSSQLSNLHEKLNQSLNLLIQESQHSYKQLFESSITQISQDVIESERNELSKREKNWSNEANRVFGLIDKDLADVNQDELNHNKERFAALSTQTTESFSNLDKETTKNLAGLGELIKREEDPNFSIIRSGLPSLDEVCGSIKQNDASIKNTLAEIDKNLKDIRRFDPKVALKSSPVRSGRSPEVESRRSPSRSPSRTISPSRTYNKHISPTKSLAGVKTKIPQLQTSLENKENQGPNQKRRRVMQEVENLLNG